MFARNSLLSPPLSERHSFATGQPTLLFSEDYGYKENTGADDGFYALLDSVLGRLSMHIIYRNKGEIDCRHYLGPSWKYGIAMSRMAWMFAAYQRMIVS